MQTRASRKSSSSYNNQVSVGGSSVNLDDVQFITEEPANKAPGSSRKTPGPPLSSARKTPGPVTPARKVPGPPGPTRSGVNITPISTPKTVPGPTIPTASSSKKTAGSGVRISANKTSMQSNSKSVKRPASPEIVVDKHFRVGKAVKITQIQDNNDNKAARISATANLPSSTKLSFIDDSPQTSSLAKFKRGSSTITQTSAVMAKIPRTASPSPAARGPPGPKSISRSSSSAPPPPGPPGPPGPPSGASKVPGPSTSKAEPKPVKKPVEKQLCVECGKSFVSISKLNQHKMAIHRETCKKCNKKFDSKELLALHDVDHMEKCEYCPQMFDTKAEVETHLETHKISCSKCADTFYRIDDVERHEKDDHHNPCYKCTVVCETKKELTKHIQDFHTYPCHYCPFLADEQGALDKHEEQNHGTCQECEDEFTWVTKDHKCYFVDKSKGPKSDRVIVQNMYFPNFTYYFI